MVGALEWWPAHYHFVQENAKAPYVESLVMASSLNHLWRKVIQRTAKGSSRDASECTPSQVRNLEHILTVDQQVFRFQVSVNYALRMQVVQSSSHLREVMPGNVLCETAISTGPE